MGTVSKKFLSKWGDSWWTNASTGNSGGYIESLMSRLLLPLRILLVVLLALALLVLRLRMESVGGGSTKKDF